MSTVGLIVIPRDARYSDLERIREGISSKFSLFTQYVSTFVFGLLVGFYTSPKLTAILLLVGPIIIGITAFLSMVSPT